MKKLYCLDLFVGLDIHARKEGRDLWVACSELLEKIDAGRVSASRSDIAEQAGGQVVGNEVWYLDLRV